MKNFRKLLFTGTFILATLMVNGLSAVGYDYDYQLTNCYDSSSGTWSTETYCDGPGSDCSRFIAHPCDPDEQ